ncbi:mechanosensitive ion channel family protein [Ekhidna sp.]|uniref:mechanosensitive ion channel family protein n=1 Tax=Ekhidna sp. TaxID=2608089 RepID=UPI003B504858
MDNEVQSVAQNLAITLEEHWMLFIDHVPSIGLAILIVAIGMLISSKVSALLRKAIAQKVEDTIMINFLGKAIKILLLGLFIMYALQVAGLDGIATGILTAAGASAVIIGFAFRDIGENFISGIILSFNRPFNVDETVSIGDIFGKVKNIEFRYTKLKTFDGRDVYIPNSDVIKKPVYNYTEDGYFRFDFLVGIAYEDDIDIAQELIMKVVNNTSGVYEDEMHHNFIITEELAVNTVNFKVSFWVKTFEYGKEALMIKGKVVTAVKNALVKEGFNLPANIQELKLYGDQEEFPVRVQQ